MFIPGSPIFLDILIILTNILGTDYNYNTIQPSILNEIKKEILFLFLIYKYIENINSLFIINYKRIIIIQHHIQK